MFVIDMVGLQSSSDSVGQDAADSEVWAICNDDMTRGALRYRALIAYNIGERSAPSDNPRGDRSGTEKLCFTARSGDHYMVVIHRVFGLAKAPIVANVTTSAWPRPYARGKAPNVITAPVGFQF